MKKSKTRSVASSKPHSIPFTVFLDESLGNKIVPQALRDAGMSVERHADHFVPGTPDQVWLAEAGKRGWVVITKDKRIRYRAGERKTLLAAGVPAFILAAGNLTSEQMARAIISAVPRMQQVLRRIRPPFIASISSSGSVRVIAPEARA